MKLSSIWRAYLIRRPSPLSQLLNLYAGVRDGSEREVLDELMDQLIIFPVTKDLAVRGGLFRCDYFKSHGIGLMDAIIAATAEKENAVVVTLNRKHFPMFSTVVVPYVRTQ